MMRKMWKYSSIFIFFCSLWDTGTAVSGVSVTGELSIQGDTNSSGVKDLKPAKLDIGDDVICNFQLTLFGGSKLRSLELILNATGLEFPTKLPARSVELEWITAAITDPTLLGKQVATAIYFEAENTQLVVLVDINELPVTSISGSYNMVVSEKTARIGSGQGFLTVRPRLLSGEMMAAIICYSTLIVTPLPLFDIKRANPFELHMGEVTTVNFELDIPAGMLTKSYAKVYLPFNEKNNEALMTVKKLRVKDVVGLNDKDGLMSTFHTSTSQTQSSEADMATLALPDILTETNVTVVIHADAQLLDFDGYKDDSELEICVGVKLNENAIWMGRSHVTINEGNITAADLVPKLDIDLSEFQRHTEDKKVNYRLKLTMSHNETSSASAYDISAFIYFPSHVMKFEKIFKKVYDGIKPYSVTGKEGKIQFDLHRISFPVSTKLMINLTLDTTNATYTVDRKLILLYDVVYKTWRRRKDYSSTTQYMELAVPEKIGSGNGLSKENDFIKPFRTNNINDQTSPETHDCPCPGDPTRNKCTCCQPGKCHCAPRYGDKCVDCHQIWMCFDIIPEYFLYSYLTEANGDGFWACNNTENPHDWRPFVSCVFYGDHSQELRPLPSTVATILGQDMTSENLYGVSNNGLGYVYSRNSGQDWISIPSSVYIRASNLPDFRMATFG